MLLAVRGETYESGHGRARDLVIGVVALGYAVWLVYAGGWQYLLVAAMFYLVGHRAATSGRAGKAACLRSPNPNWSSSRSWR